MNTESLDQRRKYKGIPKSFVISAVKRDDEEKDLKKKLSDSAASRLVRRGNDHNLIR
ncbi:protein of unknown function [Paenibacillus alvei]|uniref:Uncharacterized protein n=1 Tax=Paenibacillus alvei TaxID=44250 RepID=A0A383RA45_PAEAL|nr:protein of unknown function [Paenibacillus alvei]